MNLQPRLEDDLIILRPLRESDFEALYEVAKDPLIWEQHPISDRYEIEKFSGFFSDSIRSKGALILVEKTGKKVIGSTRFKRLNNVESAIEIGWSFLAREFWGGDYNKSMKNLMLNYAFSIVSDVVFYIDEKNIRSQKAVQKIGGKRIVEPNLRHLMRAGDVDWTYRITKDEWNKRNVNE